MTDYVITAGRSASYPVNHYGCHLIGSRATFCEDADLRNPDANILAMPDPPVSVLSSSPISVSANFFGAHLSTPGQARTIQIKTVRSHDMANGKGRWKFIETSDNVWDFTDLDAWVDAYYAVGRDLVFTLFGTPQWAAGAKSGEIGVYGGGNPGLQAPPADMTKWSRFCAKVATRYLGKIKYYEVWNEPNMNNNGSVTSGTNFFFSGTFAELGEMTRRANQAIKAVDPTAKIISPSVQGWVSSGTDTSGTYFAGMMAAPTGDGSTTLKDWIDIVAVHLYTDNATVSLAAITDRAIAARAAAGLTAKELWDTESGPIAIKAPFMTDWQIRTYLTRSMITLAAKGIARTMYYQFDSAVTGFSGRRVAEANWEGVRTLLMSGSILAASRLSDGRVAYWTATGMTII